MSLLMDALRKAELQKQKLGTAPSATESVGGLSLEPLPRVPDEAPLDLTPDVGPDPVATNSRLPELPSRLEDLDEQFLAHAAQPVGKHQTPAPPPPAPPAVEPATRPAAAPAAPPAPPAPQPDAAEAAAARNLFEAKQAPVRPNRRFAIAAGIFGFVAALGIGGYFWWQLQPQSTLMAGGTAIPPAPPAPAAVASPPQAPIPVPPASTIQVSPPPPVASFRADDDDEPPAQPVRLAPKPAATPVEPPAQPQSPVRVTKAQGKVDTTLEQAYQAFARNDLDQADTLWKKALANDPLNTDALHGMAALALRRHKADEAAGYYRRVLDVNPKDAAALSALSALRSPADPQQAESQLKLQLAEQPDSPHLNFALGNLYARLGRWPEAQHAYFRAHTADPVNPDYLFNLAISLDQLRQPRLAAQYYAQALAAAEQQPAGFDPAQVATRLNILRASLLH